MKKETRKGPQAILLEAAAAVTTTDELRDFWERFSNTSLLAVSRVSGGLEPVVKITDLIHKSMEGDRVDVGVICRTYGLSWTSPSEALSQMVNFRRILSDSPQAVEQLKDIEQFLKKHICKDVSPGHYSHLEDQGHYIDVHKRDIEDAIRELRARKQPPSARMIKEFLFDTLPFVSASAH